jgi:O-antigen/teichoic acid export membrane protein
LFDYIFIYIVKLPIEIIELSRGAFLLMVPWTAAIGYRRLWQGVLIRFQRTGFVPLIIAARLVTSITLLTVGLQVQRIPGVYAAAGALSAGVIVAAVVAYLFMRPIVRGKLSETEIAPISWQGLRRFYVPLALTSLILIASRPLITIGLSRLPGSLTSLAVWPVVFGVIFLGTSIATSYQEVVIALAKGKLRLDRLRKFSEFIFVGLLALFLLFIVTPLARVWFTRVAGLSPSLVTLSITVTGVLSILPSLGVLISWQRSMLIVSGRTSAITRSVILNIAVFVGLLVILGRFLRISGAIMAAIAFSSAVVCEWLYIKYHGTRARRQLETKLGQGANKSLPEQ